MTISWERVSDIGPALAHHTGALISDAFYIHGGITKTGSTRACNQLHRFDLGSKTWTNLTTDESPNLSHHASVAVDNRFLVVIGGWTGKARTSEIHVYDTSTNSWRQAVTEGFPQGAGLSSHTAVLLVNSDILVIGREGSLRTQRRSGNSFLIKGSAAKAQFVYHSYPTSVASRSGHTSTGIGTKVVTIGGRDDKPIETHSGFKSAEIPCDAVSRINTSKIGSSSGKFPSRKNHIAVLGRDCILIHGGETFDGRSRHPVGEMYLIGLKPHMTVKSLGVSDVCRAGHVVCAAQDVLLVHGGFNENFHAQGSVHSLTI